MSEDRPDYDAGFPTNRKPKSRKLRPATVERQQQALALRRGGATYTQIATALNYRNKSGPYKAVQSALRATLTESVEEMRQLAAMRLDALLIVLWPQAMRGNLGAIDRVIRVEQRRSRLYGLDAPVKATVDGQLLLGRLSAVAAEQYGLDPGEVLAEARRILAQVSEEG